ncbi:hypothetical protein KQJ07_16020 [Enterococcus sp. S133_ASV_20]|nr:hypothetical protein [Enterococcus sp. S133_ASV_20]MBU5545350.1 hypothetical protein [Enterococcus sp. S133_ASV_20]
MCIRDSFKAPRAVIIGVCLQFSIMPTLAFIIAKSFHLSLIHISEPTRLLSI